MEHINKKDHSFVYLSVIWFLNEEWNFLSDIIYIILARGKINFISY